eukprot:CAMPEP_0172809824 /NCGR_PEP_ID=MMETSP1075-20121228/8432_1 /TAXON_ID=2916 /ORGANISM="Ceratium fusus, Strain PA161109" /LENGTH=189 /DNA_ID=CAMNT_0013649065 /DNA_START=60 /DNA_END=629 /DNA_ORIENTATION=+
MVPSDAQASFESTQQPPSTTLPALRKPVRKKVVSVLEIEGHFPISFTESGSVCPICLVEIGALDPCRKTTCNHEFHADCIMKWWTNERGKVLNCPTCREAQKVSVNKVRQVSIDVRQKESLRQQVTWSRSLQHPARQGQEEANGSLAQWFASMRLVLRRPLGMMSHGGGATETPTEETSQTPTAEAEQH